MPTYEYRCSEGHLFEQFQRMSEPPVSECPQCGAPAERLLSAGAGLLFKGSGFYITDYRSESYRKAAAAEGAGGTGGGSEGTKKDAGATASPAPKQDAGATASPTPKKDGGGSAGGAAAS